MTFGRLALMASTLALLLAPGCGGNAGEAPTPDSTDTSGVPLPEWAPENPSPELLRAAKVLRPLPEEVEPYSPTWPLAWELFGTLSDKQIDSFLRHRQRRQLPLERYGRETIDALKDELGAEEIGDSLVFYTREVLITFGSLSPGQRTIFDRMVEASRNRPPEARPQPDLLVQLYKIGAREDLSNVAVGFSASGHVVSTSFVVKDKDASLGRSVALLSPDALEEK